MNPRVLGSWALAGGSDHDVIELGKGLQVCLEVSRRCRLAEKEGTVPSLLPARLPRPERVTKGLGPVHAGPPWDPYGFPDPGFLFTPSLPSHCQAFLKKLH